MQPVKIVVFFSFLRLLLSLQEICETLIFHPRGEAALTFQLKSSRLQSAINSRITANNAEQEFVKQTTNQQLDYYRPVSYTHLTLPTIYSV